MFDRLMTTAAALALSAGAALAAPDRISVGMVLEPPSLDPTAGAAAAIDEVVYANIFEGLTRFGPDGAVRPALAESWEVAPDGLIYTFHLHDGVTFHDGTTMDAEDVKFSLDRARAEDSTNAQKALFAGIDAVDGRSTRAPSRSTLKAPDGNFPFNLAWGDAVIVAPESIGDRRDQPGRHRPVHVLGTGSRATGSSSCRNDDYWGEPVALAKATFRFISDPTAAFAAMMAGDVDAFPNFPAPETLAAVRRRPALPGASSARPRARRSSR